MRKFKVVGIKDGGMGEHLGYIFESTGAGYCTSLVPEELVISHKTLIKYYELEEITEPDYDLSTIKGCVNWMMDHPGEYLTSPDFNETYTIKCAYRHGKMLWLDKSDYSSEINDFSWFESDNYNWTPEQVDPVDESIPTVQNDDVIVADLKTSLAEIGAAVMKAFVTNEPNGHLETDTCVRAMVERYRRGKYNG